jgi:hypothetical protein
MTPFLQDLRDTLRQICQAPDFAQRRNLLTLLLRGASLLLLVGIAIGIGAGLFTAHLVDNFLYNTAASSQHRCLYPSTEHPRHGRLHTMPSLSTCKSFTSNRWETE